ncbi:hypothetical protein LXA43DRAFT_1104864 [Ganoderma leucocontextum]|nr:hypothetical protein LXA43DRAFT_1104864 [Ganoderma leucocontextum]
MFADVPENDIAQNSAATSSTTARGRAPATQFSRSPRPSGSRPPAPDRTRGSKRQKLNDGSAGVPMREIIELSSDEEDAPPASTRRTPTRSQSPLPTNRPTNRPRKRLFQAPDTLVTVSKAAKKPQATQKNKATQHKQVIVISDDERPTIVRTSNAREVIIISDEDEPVNRGSVAQSTGAGGSNIAPVRADPTAPRDELVSRRFPSLTPCTSFRVTRNPCQGQG